MSKLLKYTWLSVLVLFLFLCGGLYADRQTLQEELIRLHVIANSDSEADQSRKLMVRDAVTAYLQEEMAGIESAQDAKTYLHSKLDQIQAVADQALYNAGSTDRVQVSLGQEAYDTREYDTFSLPAGIYESLRIEIGEAQGQNWWCVVFPSLCLPVTVEGFEDTAVSCGISDGLADTLTGEDGYEVRFFVLDCLGKIENFLFGS